MLLQSLLLLFFAVSVSPHLTDTAFNLVQVNRHNGNNGEEVVPAERYECDCCGQVYKHRTSLCRHQRQAHMDRRTCPERGEVFQGEECLARRVTREHRGQRRGAADGQLATIPPPTTGDAVVNGVVSDNWHVIVFRHRIHLVQNISKVRCWNKELQLYQPKGGWQQRLANFEDGVESALQMQGDGEHWCSFGAQNEW